MTGRQFPQSHSAMIDARIYVGKKSNNKLLTCGWWCILDSTAMCVVVATLVLGNLKACASFLKVILIPIAAAILKLLTRIGCAVEEEALLQCSAVPRVRGKSTDAFYKRQKDRDATSAHEKIAVVWILC